VISPTQDRPLGGPSAPVGAGPQEAATLWKGLSEGTTPWTFRRRDVFGIIEVGAVRARFDVFRRGDDGTLQAVWRDEQAITAVSLPAPATTPPPLLEGGERSTVVDERLVQGLRRFQRVCGRHRVTVGAVVHASDALNNHPETLPRLFRMTGVSLKQISEREAARLLCLGLLRDENPGRKTLVVDVGAEATQVILAHGEEPVALWRLGVGTAEGAGGGDASSGSSSPGLRHLRAQVRRSLRQTRLDAVRGAASRAVTGRDALDGRGTSPADGRVRVILEEVAAFLRLDGIRALDRGLREGILFDLCRAASRALA
jgi:hypothetical protein